MPFEEFRLAGPGRLLLIVERENGRELEVHGEGGRRVIAMERPIEARFLTPDRVLVLREVPLEGDYGLPEHEILVIDLATGQQEALPARARYYDAEPAPDGRILAINREAEGIGDADLEIWSLDAAPVRLALRRQSLEEPRWSPEGDALLASVLMPDPEGAEEAGGSFGGTSFQWPRLHRFRRDLGDPALVPDGSGDGALAPGGSLPLWWNARGVFVRQREGLLRCDLDAGRCIHRFDPGPDRRIAAGTPIGAPHALLLTVIARDAFDRNEPDEIVRVDLATGRATGRWRARSGEAFLEIDWIEAAPSAIAPD